jgi:predicted DNA repair protein MutK
VLSISQAIDFVAEATAHALPSAAGPVKWATMAFLSGIVGLLIGAVSIPVIGFVFAPARKLLKGLWYKGQG